MSSLKMWVSGQMHPATPRRVYVNCYEYDRVQRILIAHCKVCGYAVSRDEAAVREINFKCDNRNCCPLYQAFKAHQVCDLCYHMFHSLYVNYSMKNMNYFKEMDEKEKKEYDNFKKRDDNKL